jgi:hypothetical protein
VAKQLFLTCACLLVLGCDDAETTPIGEPAARDAGACVPSELAFRTSIEPLFETHCGGCHGKTPSGGAPFSLLGYDGLLAPDTDGVRPVDRIATALASGAMPPGDQPQPSVHERADLAAWASCDAVNLHPTTDLDGGMPHDHGDAGLPMHGPLVASRTPVSAGEAPAGALPITLTLDEFQPPVGGDHYESKWFTGLVSETRFIRYFEPVIDDARVVHHLTMRFGGNRSGYVYTWGPGGSALELPGGGIRLEPEDTLRVEVHYHNGVGASDIADSSGVRIYVDEPTGTEYGIANLASWDIYVPAHGTGEAHESCAVSEPVHVYAAWPHMHETGDALEHTIVHADSSAESLIDLSGWDFHSQRIYAIDVDLAAGDRLDLTCRYLNGSDHDVTAGSATTDEMCFEFLYVTPPHALDACNDSLSL